jgi:general stress protein YciG
MGLRELMREPGQHIGGSVLGIDFEYVFNIGKVGGKENEGYAFY